MTEMEFIHLDLTHFGCFMRACLIGDFNGTNPIT